MAEAEQTQQIIAPFDSEPHQVIQITTDQTLVAIKGAKSYFDEDPDRYFAEIARILDSVVDFESFARGVMGKFASKSLYASLQTDAERQIFMDRVMQFMAVFRTGLVRTYGQGVLAFSKGAIEVVPPQESPISGASVNVEQRIQTGTEKPITIRYKLRQDQKMQWKLRNVTINEINLGKLYRNQFASAMRRYKGDINKVIETWIVTESTSDNA